VVNFLQYDVVLRLADGDSGQFSSNSKILNMTLCAMVRLRLWLYEGRSINSRTVLLSKHTVTAKNQNSYEVVQPLLYITQCGFVYDVTL